MAINYYTATEIAYWGGEADEVKYKIGNPEYQISPKDKKGKQFQLTVNPIVVK